MKPYATAFLVAGICGVIWLLIDRKSSPEDVAALSRAIQYRDVAADAIKSRVSRAAQE